MTSGSGGVGASAPSSATTTRPVSTLPISSSTSPTPALSTLNIYSSTHGKKHLSPSGQTSPILLSPTLPTVNVQRMQISQQSQARWMQAISKR